jgi:hypothetical protein
MSLTVAEVFAMLAKCTLMTPALPWVEYGQTDDETPTIYAIENLFGRKVPWTGPGWSVVADPSGAPLHGLQCSMREEDWDVDDSPYDPAAVRETYIYDELLGGLFVSDDIVGEWHDDGSGMSSYYIVGYDRRTGKTMFSVWVDPSDSALERVKVYTPAEPACVLRGHEELACFLEGFFGMPDAPPAE